MPPVPAVAVDSKEAVSRGAAGGAKEKKEQSAEDTAWADFENLVSPKSYTMHPLLILHHTPWTLNPKLFQL